MLCTSEVRSERYRFRLHLRTEVVVVVSSLLTMLTKIVCRDEARALGWVPARGSLEKLEPVARFLFES
jgi:hypothetical protein